MTNDCEMIEVNLHPINLWRKGQKVQVTINLQKYHGKIGFVAHDCSSAYNGMIPVRLDGWDVATFFFKNELQRIHQ